MTLVLDASALLAYLHQEPGWKMVQAVVSKSCIGAVNWCEVAQKATQKGLDIARARNLLGDVGLVIIPFTQEQAESAASLWERTRRNSLSLADRACLALAIERGVTVLTADQAWGELDLGINIQIMR